MRNNEPETNYRLKTPFNYIWIVINNIVKRRKYKVNCKFCVKQIRVSFIIIYKGLRRLLREMGKRFKSIIYN